MICRFNSKLQNTFVIDGFAYNKPLLIKWGGLYLTNVNDKPYAEFTLPEQDTQKWVILPDCMEENVFYIKTRSPKKYGESYLGAPNIDNIVYLYTSKTRFTRWKIVKSGANVYTIDYIGEKYDIQKHTIVIARYNEETSWALPYKDCVILYNKGQSITHQFNNVISLVNIGREGDTYLRHIINNYDNLSERVTFLQGGPLVHNETLLYGLDNYDKFDPFQNLGLRWLSTRNIPPSSIIEKNKIITKYKLHHLFVKINLDLEYIDDFAFFDPGITALRHNYYARFGKSDKIISGFLKRCGLDLTMPIDYVYFSFSALFSATKTDICLHSREDYIKILKELLKYDSQGGIEGYILERLWGFLLDNNTKIEL